MSRISIPADARGVALPLSREAKVDNCMKCSQPPFMNDTDEEVDTAEIEEGDWIEYMKRSTDEAMRQMRTAKIQCWIKNTQKNEMETSDENRIATRREMGSESS